MNYSPETVISDLPYQVWKLRSDYEKIKQFAEKNTAPSQKRINHSGESEIKPFKIKRLKQNAPKNLLRLNTGEEIVNLVLNTCVLYSNHDHLENDEQMQVISQFFQIIQEFMDVASEFGPSYYVEMAFEFTKWLKQLEDLGFWVFGAKEIQLIEGGIGDNTTWPTVISGLQVKTMKQ